MVRLKEVNETVNGTATNDSDRYFTEHGQRKGPVTAASLLELLQTQTISGETPVWRKGFTEWQTLRSTELGVHLQDAPSPVASTHINNGLVWTLAIAPIAYALLAGFRDEQILTNPYDDHTLVRFLGLAIPLSLNAALCLLDERQLKRAGFADRWLTFFGVLLAPVYLFMRAKRIRQFPSYGFVWIVSLVISFLLSIPGGFFTR